MYMSDTATLFSKWQSWIDYDLLREIQDLIIFKHIADAFAASLKPFAGKEVDWSDLVLWMSVNYVANTASAIRRLLDQDRNSISLYRLLEDVKNHAALLTPENLSTYRGDIGPWQPPGGIEHALDSDLQLLSTKPQSIRSFVNKTIAHTDRHAHKITPPTYGDFNDAIHMLHRIYRTWALVVAGRGCQGDNPNPNDLLPMDPPD